MQHSEGTFEGAGGASIYYQYWLPEGPVRAVFLLAHGAAEHCARYQHVAEYFAEHGYAMAGLDHEGHGRSEGARGYVRNFDDFLETLGIFHAQINKDFGDLPTILLGHSMGGLIGTSYLLDHQDDFAACILSGPAIKTDLEPGWLQMTIIRLLSAILPKMGVLPLDANGVCRDPETVQRYREDPLVFSGKLSARLVSELFNTMAKVQAGAKNITLPMQMLHGEKDSMASPAGSRFLYEQLGSKNKDLKIYPELFHEVFNEPEREQVFKDMLSWLEDTLGLPAAQL